MTGHGPVGIVCYSGSPQVDPSPSRKWLRRMGLPDPYETIEMDLTGLSPARRRQLTAELVSALDGGDMPAALHRARATRRGWYEASRGADAVAQFLDAFDTDDWWAGELALLVRGHGGPGVVFPSSDAEQLVVVFGGNRSRSLSAEMAELVVKVVSEHGPE